MVPSVTDFRIFWRHRHVRRMRLITFGSLGHNAQIDSYLLLWGYRFQGSILLTISSFKLLGFTAGIILLLEKVLSASSYGHLTAAKEF